MSPKEVGYTRPHQKSQWALGVIFGLVISVCILAIDLAFALLKIQPLSFKPPIVETIIFRFLMPGLSEEPIFRGVILGLFNRYYGRSWKLFGVPIGWGLILSSVLFGVLHLVIYRPGSMKIIWQWDSIIPILIISLILGWLREKTGSIWPCVICHSLIDTLPYIGRILLS